MIAAGIGQHGRGLRVTFATTVVAMRFAVVATLAGALACGGHSPNAVGPQLAAAPEATRWVPEHPTLVIASPAIADAQHDLRDVVDALSVLTGFGAAELSGAASGLVGVDVLSPEALAGIGIDVHASWAIFSDGHAGAFDPTIVLHLAAPAKMTEFLDHQRARGLASTQATVDQVQVSSAELVAGVTLRWAIAGDWMWLHVSRVHPNAGPDDATHWFTASHGPHGAAWGDHWAWAVHAAGPAASVVGFADLHTVHDQLIKILDGGHAVPACHDLVPPFNRLAIALHGDPHQLTARFALDIGPTALATHLLPAPSGWSTAAASAAIAAQWNLDASAIHEYFAPCMTSIGKGDSFDELIATGIRTVRGMLVSFDPDSAVGTGAITADLSQSDYLGHALDRVPMRSTLESPRTFAGHRGARIEIPFSFTVEYVLEPHLLVGAMGDGLVSQILAAGTPPSPPLLSLDVAPPKLPVKTWATLIQALADRKLTGRPGPRAQRAAEHLVRWRAAHVAVTAEGNEVVLTATGER